MLQLIRFPRGPEARVTIAAICLVILIAGCALGESPVLGPQSTVDDVLDALQVSGKNLKTFTATVRTDDFNAIQGTDTFRNGKVAMKIHPDGGAQLHLVYTDRQFGTKKPVAERKEYVLDDRWVTDRDFTTMNQVRRQIARPGQNVDIFQLGKGPIPMPIGQDKKEVHARFEVIIAPPDKDDPANSIHLILTPKPNTEYSEKYKTVDVWVDPALKMPVRITTTDPKGSSTTTHDLTDMRINPDIPKGEFQLPPLDPKWQSHDEPM